MSKGVTYVHSYSMIYMNIYIYIYIYIHIDIWWYMYMYPNWLSQYSFSRPFHPLFILYFGDQKKSDLWWPKTHHPDEPWRATGGGRAAETASRQAREAFCHLPCGVVEASLRERNIRNLWWGWNPLWDLQEILETLDAGEKSCPCNLQKMPGVFILFSWARGWVSIPWIPLGWNLLPCSNKWLPCSLQCMSVQWQHHRLIARGV